MADLYLLHLQLLLLRSVTWHTLACMCVCVCVCVSLIYNSFVGVIILFCVCLSVCVSVLSSGSNLCCAIINDMRFCVKC